MWFLWFIFHANEKQRRDPICICWVACKYTYIQQGIRYHYSSSNRLVISFDNKSNAESVAKFFFYVRTSVPRRQMFEINSFPAYSIINIFLLFQVSIWRRRSRIFHPSVFSTFIEEFTWVSAFSYLYFHLWSSTTKMLWIQNIPRNVDNTKIICK